MFAIAQPPAKQNATDTIAVLSSRLQNATLLEDRRSAILGLRSFSREYPASVASGALRGLIQSLSNDAEDVDTIKSVLETLLQLFNPDSASPEASEELSTWLADEFTLRQDNITMLLDLLERNDYHTRVNALQLLSSILSLRAERTEECIMTARLGITRLVAILDDTRDVIRDEGLGLLIYLTPSSTELQKVVAFENAFDRVFTIISNEGSLSQGGRVVENCLVLLGNLLRLNASNQSFFRETNCVAKLAKLLQDALTQEDSDAPLNEWATLQRNRNIYALLAVLRLFLIPSGSELATNQVAFARSGILRLVLDLGFDQVIDLKIKAEALMTCADIIRANAYIQTDPFQCQVTSPLYVPPPTQINGNVRQKAPPPSKVHVVYGLLELVLGISNVSAFDVRFAACECLKAYYANNPTTRHQFLDHAIDSHKRGDFDMNIVSTLLQPTPETVAGDPYRYWLSAVLLFHLVFDDMTAKAKLRSVVEGNAEEGEDEVTCIQTLSENLLSGIAGLDDERVLVGQLMLLCGWLFEDLEAVNDFLEEGSSLQGLVNAVQQSKREGDSILVSGLCSLLLGIIYEFSTKDSPIPRATLQSIIASGTGKEQYINRLTALRREPLLRDFEVLPQKLLPSEPGLPMVFFDKCFVDFAKDNHSRIVRAIDRDPDTEVSILSREAQKGVSRTLVDSLRDQLVERDRLLQSANSEVVELQQRLRQEQNDHVKAAESRANDLNKLKAVNQALRAAHDEELDNISLTHSRQLEQITKQAETAQKTADGNAIRTRHEHEVALSKMQTSHSSAIETLQRELQHVRKTAENELERARRRAEAEASELRKQGQALQTQLDDTKKHRDLVLTQLDDSKKYSASLRTQLDQAGVQTNQLTTQVNDAREQAKVLQEQLDKMKAQHTSTINELTTKHEQEVADHMSHATQISARIQELEAQLSKAQKDTTEAKSELESLRAEVDEKESAREAAQAELDDLLMVFGDLEEQAEKYKERLVALGENVDDEEADDGGDGLEEVEDAEDAGEDADEARAADEAEQGEDGVSNEAVIIDEAAPENSAKGEQVTAEPTEGEDVQAETVENESKEDVKESNEEETHNQLDGTTEKSTESKKSKGKKKKGKA